MKQIEIIIPRKKKTTAIRALQALQINNYNVVTTDGKYKVEFMITETRTDEVLNDMKKRLEIGKSLEDGVILMSDKTMVAPFALEKETVKDPEHDITERARRAANIDKNHIIILALSTIIAVIGLQTNNTLVIFGALLIAPVMDPILGNTYGIIKKKASIVKNASKTLTLSLYIILIISFVVPLITFRTDVTDEMMSRTSVAPTDLLLATVIGSIAALAFAKDQSTTLIGVAAAISLMPPLANAGILLLLGLYGLSLNAFTLFISNLLGMYAGSIFTFLIMEYGSFKKQFVKKPKS